ncbi:MAG: amino acid ABC transporter permease [Planctomycetota bacterium]|jgi:polar amino acid transport system permease protein
MDVKTFSYFFMGLVNTLLLAACSLGVALIWGLIIALGRLSSRAIIRWPSTLYVEFIRGVPLLVLIVWIYFGFSGKLFSLTDFPAAVLAFGICYGAFIGETYRAGIESVDKGQTEAARALGMSKVQTLRHVVLPQALRNILPALGNESIALLKDTSLAMVIGFSELMMRAHTTASREFNFMEVYTAVALVYLATTVGLTRIQRLLERRFGGGTGHLRPARA